MLPARVKPLHSHDLPATTAILTVEDAQTCSPASADDAEDILTSFLPHLYPDEAPLCLGDPGKTVLYTSGAWGDVTVMVPGYPKGSEEEVVVEEERPDMEEGVEGGRRLFAHYLWGGGLVVADGIERAVRHLAGDGAGEEKDLLWSVKGEKVLELGAGAALPSLISALAGAAQVTITDHPSSPALYGTIQANIANNIPLHLQSRIFVQSHEWGVLGSDAVSSQESRTQNPETQAASISAVENQGSYTRIIAADCLWMRDQHENLIRSLLWFLAPPSPPSPPSLPDGDGSNGAARGGVAWVVAGFHTGREIVASFFETAVAMGLLVEQIWERDVNATSEEGVVTREWMPVRPGEGPENRARWCVVAFLRKGLNS
ncbi:nicotinamide N-methyltransferase [Histoplasma capsulatum G186AR]|uniref:Nicotinamide N-methyltransferase n=1 Tax=Ajellomyces capsulatus TaxID=5037 RepID=A0A8H8CS09_AJECA|nr:nicotinamide N-methyltransferase [Histoplasma capsulatum]QSS70466.1 nicotinamide N-methyltransferase [Histoplasma capsulatum G186AR]